MRPRRYRWMNTREKIRDGLLNFPVERASFTDDVSGEPFAVLGDQKRNASGALRNNPIIHALVDQRVARRFEDLQEIDGSDGGTKRHVE